MKFLSLLLAAGSVCLAGTAEASAARGLDAWAEFLRDCIVKFDAKHITTGREEALRDLAPGFAQPGFDFRWEPIGGEIGAGGDLGFTYGTYTLKFNSKDGKLVEKKGHNLTVWKKQSDGAWKVAADVGN